MNMIFNPAPEHEFHPGRITSLSIRARAVLKVSQESLRGGENPSAHNALNVVNDMLDEIERIAIGIREAGDAAQEGGAE